MSTPTTPPGWYPDPSGQPGQRYHDGQRWTKHFTPAPPPPAPAPAPAPSVAVAVSAGTGTNHALHLILTLLSCGLWLPIWILVAIFDTRGSTAVAVGGAGASTGPRFNRTPLIIGGVILGLAVLGQAAQHPWLFVLLFLLVGAGGVFFWKQKTAKDAKEQELREQYRRDVIADRADYENEMWHEGDPRGTYGRYPPPPEEDLR
jgi:Protein of unknown function (DUF2510)